MPQPARDPDTGKFLGAKSSQQKGDDQASENENVEVKSSDPVPLTGTDTAATVFSASSEALALGENSTGPDLSIVPPAPVGGTPPSDNSLDKSQTDIKRGRGRPPLTEHEKQQRRAARGIREPSFAAQVAPENRNLDTIFIANTANGMFSMSLSLIFGEDAALAEQEMKQLNMTLGAYLDMKGVQMSPEMALVLAYSGIVLKRMTKPTAREKIMKAGITVTERIKGLFRRKKKEQEQ
jgi:hypothetical protein